MAEQQREVLKRAVKMLREEALGIQQGHTLSGNWDGEEEAKSAHDEMLAVASQLEALSHAERREFKTEQDLISFLDGLYETAGPDSSALTGQKWVAAQRAIEGIRSHAEGEAVDLEIGAGDVLICDLGTASAAGVAFYRDNAAHDVGTYRPELSGMGGTELAGRIFSVMTEKPESLIVLYNAVGRALATLGHPAPQVAGLTETAIKSSPAYRALHREKEHLLGLLKERAPQVAVPECCRSQPCKRPGTGPCDMPAAQQPVSDPDGLPGTPRPMSTAPRDGTMVLLLVQFTNHGVNDGFDSGPAWTIGANTYDDSGDDEWHIAGWDWQQDCFTAGEGEPLGWLPMLSAPAPDEREIAACPAGILEWAALEIERMPGNPETLVRAAGFLRAEAARLRAGKEGE